jgi:Fe2+ or Zn2+ uptake regulation protein
VPPPGPLSALQEDILLVLRQAGRRLTGEEVIRRLEEDNRPWGESSVRHALAAMVAAGLLDNRRGCRPRGYSVP